MDKHELRDAAEAAFRVIQAQNWRLIKALKTIADTALEETDLCEAVR